MIMTRGLRSKRYMTRGYGEKVVALLHEVIEGFSKIAISIIGNSKLGN